MNKRRIVIAVFVVAVATACSLAVGAFGSTSHKRSPKWAASQHTHRKPNRRLVSAIEALRAVRQSDVSSEPLPANVAEAMLQPVATSQPLGLEPADAVEVTGTNYPTWIVPGSNGVCVISTGIVGGGTADGVCSSVANALAGHLVKVSMAGPSEAITTGLAPDGASSVTVTKTDGSVQRVSVEDNVYEVRGTGVKSVSLTGSGGAQLHIQTPTAG